MAQLVSPVIVGREGELDAVDAALDDARSGNGSVLIVSGEAGIGKSRLAHEAAERARTAGMRVLAGRAVPTGTPVPYRPFAEAMQSGLRDAAAVHESSLDPYRRALGRLLPEVEPEPSSEQDLSPLVLMEGILRLLAVTAGGTGLLLVLEDIQWADADTLAVVEYLADHLGPTGVLCLCTERTDSDGPAAALVTSLAARRDAERLVLEPLSDEDVSTMAALILGDEAVPAGVAQALRARAAGVPFLVEEALAAYVAAGGPGQRAPEWWISRRIAAALPVSYRDAVEQRLAGLDGDARRVVAAAALIGRSFDWRLLARIAGLDDAAVVTKLRAAEAARLISADVDHFAVGFEFRHALAREAVLAAMFPLERAELSLRAAAAIHAAYPGLPGDWCQRAADLYQQGGDRLRACGVLLEAAQRAVARSAFGSAEATLAHARELAADDWMAWMRIDDLLLEVYAHTGQTERVLELGYGLIDVYKGRYRGGVAASRLAELHLRIARGIAPAGDSARVHTELAEAGRLAAAAEDETLTARIAALAAQVALVEGVERAAELAAVAQEAAERLGLADVLCEALDARGQAVARTGDRAGAAALFARCERTAELHGLPLWRVRALLELGVLDSLASARLERLFEARTLARDMGAVSALAAIELQLAWAHLGRAELEEAAATIGAALDLALPHLLDLVTSVLAAQCMLHALLDEPADLDRAAAQARAHDLDPADEARIVGNGSVVLYLARGDDAAALALLDRIRPRAETATDWTLSWLTGLHSLLAAASGRAEPATPPASLDPLTDSYLAYARAVTLGRAGERDQALAETAHADAAMAAGWRRAHARLVLARCAFADGWGDPVSWMRESLAYLDAVSLSHFAAAARAALRRAGAPVPRRGRGTSPVPPELQERGVTTREMDVLHLVAERLSNTEIGRLLYLSPRTVEDHVANLRRKLGAETRRDLADLARTHARSDHGASSG